MSKKYLCAFLLVVAFLFFGQIAKARDVQNITDWYIQNFETNVVVNKDSSLVITENITADCGDLLNKHGIFRVLPTQINTDKGIFKSPIDLVSITDFNGKPYKYEIINNNSNHTVTWKIGDPDIVVTGVNNYKITYKVKNAIRFGNKDFDELYWNFSGNFWDIDIDNFSAHITFPPEVNSSNSTVDYYTGMVGSKDKYLATYSWDSNNALNFVSPVDYQSPIFTPGQGLTVSVAFPKNIFVPYVPTFLEKYADYFSYVFFLIPFAIFIFAFNKWRKYGKDPKMKKPIPPEFGIPDNITPIQMGMVLGHGKWKNTFLTATIVDLAVRKFITIEQTENKGIILGGKDIVLKKNTENYDLNKVTPTEKAILDALFQEMDFNTAKQVMKNLSSGIFGKSFKKIIAKSGMLSEEEVTKEKDTVKLSSLKNSFSLKLSGIIESATEEASSKGWVIKAGNKYAVSFMSTGAIFIWASVWAGAFFQSWQMFFSVILSGIILILFAIFMPKRTQAGVDLLFKIKGFELYMKTAENYRQQFYEKENIFDKFLPYAIVFGIAELWAKKMQLIYGEDYFKSYHPIWFAGTMPTNFSIDSFTSQLDSISSNISEITSSPSSSSGFSGGGMSGGGGGGGGGGGW